MKFAAFALLIASVSATKLVSRSPHIPGWSYDPNFMKNDKPASMMWEKLREFVITHIRFEDSRDSLDAIHQFGKWHVYG